MFTIAQGLRAAATEAATKMFAANETIAPVISPGGATMLHVSTEKDRLRGAFMEMDLDGKTVYLGLPA